MLPHAITDVTVALATKIMQAAKKNAREEIKRRRQAEEDDGEIVVALKKKLKTAMDEKKAAKASHGKDTGRVKLASASIEDSLAKPPKHKLTRLDRWQLGPCWNVPGLGYLSLRRFTRFWCEPIFALDPSTWARIWICAYVRCRPDCFHKG